jgi:type II secretory pathway component PulC
MLRSVIIRQLFVLLDLGLVALFITAAILLAATMAKPAPRAALDIPVSAVPHAPEDSLNLDIDAREAYAAITSNGLFGPAGRAEVEAAPPPPPPPPEENLEETSLNLRLLGTVALSPGNPLSSAAIENLDQPGNSRSYALEEEVAEKVTLADVFPREVILLNEQVNPPRRERLRMDEEDLSGIAASAARNRQQTAARQDSGPDRVYLKRREMVELIENSYAELVTKVRPQMVRDSSGNIIGMTTDNIDDFELARKLGFRDGDVLQTVNNERIDSEQKIMEMIQKYGDSSAFRIGIMRNGNPQVITYRLD